MKKVYLYKRFERFWHWAQTLLVLTLMITGFDIHGSTSFMDYETAVEIHNYTAWAFIVLIVFAIFWHITTDEWKQYMPTAKNMNAQVKYYLTGIFKNAPHPTKKRTLSKLNPLQRLTYFALKIIIIPAMVITGLMYMYFNYPVPGFEMDSLELVALVHTFSAYLLLTFLIVHLYLITTGHTVTSNLKAMVTGWEIMDDEDVKEIVEEAVEEAGKKIKPFGNDKEKGHQEIKDLIKEALLETEQKVDLDLLKGQDKASKDHKTNLDKKKP